MARKFSEMIREKEGILLRLVPISIQQLNIVRSGDTSRLLSLLAQKQQVLDEFEALERELEPFRDIPPEQRVWKNEEERTQTESALRRCKKMLKEILDNDTQSTEEISAQKTEVEEQLRRIRQNAKISHSYVKPQAEEGTVRRFDVMTKK